MTRSEMKVFIKESVNEVLGILPEDNPFGVIAQFEGPTELLHAAKAVRGQGYRRFDTFSPFPVHGMPKAMGIRFSLIPLLSFGGGLTGCIAGFAMQYWMNGVNYPIVISDKPFFSLPAFIPVMFELTILLAAFGAVFGMFFINRLPMFYHPVFKNAAFARVTADGFFLTIEARDKQFDPQRTQELLASLGGRNVALLEP